MFEIFTNTFTSITSAIGASFPHLFNNLFILDGKLNGYAKLCVVGVSISVIVWVFNFIFNKTRRIKKYEK